MAGEDLKQLRQLDMTAGELAWLQPLNKGQLGRQQANVPGLQHPNRWDAQPGQLDAL